MNVDWALYRAQSPSNDTSSIIAGIGGNHSLLFRYKEDFIEGSVGTFAVQ